MDKRRSRSPKRGVIGRVSLGTVRAALGNCNIAKFNYQNLHRKKEVLEGTPLHGRWEITLYFNPSLFDEATPSKLKKAVFAKFVEQIKDEKYLGEQYQNSRIFTLVD